MTSEARNEGSPQTTGSVWIVMANNEYTGRKWVHGVFEAEAGAAKEVESRNHIDRSTLYFKELWIVTPNEMLTGAESVPSNGVVGTERN